MTEHKHSKLFLFLKKWVFSKKNLKNFKKGMGVKKEILKGVEAKKGGGYEAFVLKEN